MGEVAAAAGLVQSMVQAINARVASSNSAALPAVHSPSAAAAIASAAAASSPAAAAAAAAHATVSDSPQWSDFLARCAVGLDSDTRSRSFAALFKDRVMQQWCGLVTGVNTGGLFSQPCVYVRMDPSEAKHSESDIKLVVGEALARTLSHLVPGQIIMFDAKFTEIGYWFHHEMQLVAYQPLPRTPKPGIRRQFGPFEIYRMIRVFGSFMWTITVGLLRMLW